MKTSRSEILDGGESVAKQCRRERAGARLLDPPLLEDETTFAPRGTY